jgi:hypothetical protein
MASGVALIAAPFALLEALVGLSTLARRVAAKPLSPGQRGTLKAKLVVWPASNGLLALNHLKVAWHRQQER